MPRIPENDIDRIKATIDLGALVRSRGVELRRHGERDLIGRCPFHEEDTASFVVTAGKGLWHCMGCGAAGNVIQFVEKFDRVSFRHAFELLAAGAGFAPPSEGLKSVSTVPRLESPIEYAAGDAELMGQIVDYYHERLMSAATGAPARSYLAKRGLDDAETLKRFRIGFADRSLGLRLPHKNRAAGAEIRSRLTRLGIYRESGHEHLNGCVIVPMFAPHGENAGRVTGLYGRRIDDGGKSGIKHLYLPGPHVGLFNAEALDGEEVILCEALLDALTFVAAGFPNATSIYGTEGFTGELLEEMNRRKVRRVKLAYDADEAGERAAARDAEKLRAVGIEVCRIKFPWGMDVNEYARKVSPAAQSLRLLVNSAAWMGSGAVKAEEPAAPVEEVAPAPSSLAASVSCSSPFAKVPTEEEAAKKEKQAVQAHETKASGPSAMPEAAINGTLEQRGEAWFLALDNREYRVTGLEKTLGADHLKIGLRVRTIGQGGPDRFHLDQIDLMRDAERRRFIERAAEETGLTPELLKRDLGRVLLAVETAQAQMMKPAEAVAAAVELSPEERAEALAWLREANLIERLREAFRLSGIIGEDNNTLVAYLAGVSRKLDRPLAIIIQSASAAGKTTLMDAVLSFFPEEDRVKYSAMTGQSLYYLGETNLKHKILAVVEEAGAEKASYALKLLQSEGELTIASTGKDPNTGRMVTQEYHVEGPVMIFLTTTAIDIDEELMNRCLIITVDESREQTARIHQLQRERRTLAGLVAREERKDVLTLLKNAQRLLVPVEILNPFAPRLTFPSGRTRNRRDHEKYLTLIDAIALLHQHQRARGQHVVQGRMVEYIEVTLDDIALANEIAPEVLGRSLDELPPQTRTLLEHIRVLVKTKRESVKTAFSFSRREIKELSGWSLTQVRVHLARLIELEFIAARSGRFGSAFHYELLIDADGPAAHIGLIDVEELRVRAGDTRAYDRNLAGENGHLAGGGETPPAKDNELKASTLASTSRPDAPAHQEAVARAVES